MALATKTVTFGLYTMRVPADWGFRVAGDGEWLWKSPDDGMAVHIGQQLVEDLSVDEAVEVLLETAADSPGLISSGSTAHPEGAVIRSETLRDDDGTKLVVVDCFGLYEYGKSLLLFRTSLFLSREGRETDRGEAVRELFDRQVRELSLRGEEYGDAAQEENGPALRAWVLPGSLHICLTSDFELREDADGQRFFHSPLYRAEMNAEIDGDGRNDALAESEAVGLVLEQEPALLARTWMHPLRDMYAQRLGPAVETVDDTERMIFRSVYDDGDHDPPLLIEARPMRMIRLWLTVPLVLVELPEALAELVETLEREVGVAYLPTAE